MRRLLLVAGGATVLILLAAWTWRPRADVHRSRAASAGPGSGVRVAAGRTPRTRRAETPSVVEAAPTSDDRPRPEPQSDVALVPGTAVEGVVLDSVDGL